MIKLKELLRELSYSGNLGVMELVDFYDKASNSQVAMLQNYINAKKWKSAHELIQTVTGVQLVGFEEDQEIAPSVDPEAILNPDTSKSFERSKKWAGSMEIT